MHLDKQHNKNQNVKNLPQRYNYSSNISISSFKQIKCCNICPLENFKNSNKIKTHSSVSAVKKAKRNMAHKCVVY